MIKLDKRLKCLLSEIQGETIADIGCDHGKLAVSAVLGGFAKSTIAVDISAESLAKTSKLADICGVSDRISCRVGDGFMPIKERSVDTAVIAGVGGYEIAEILANCECEVKRFVLCPHQNADKARLALNTLGYSAVKDYIVESNGKFYPIIVAERCAEFMPYKKGELRFGINNPPTQAYEDMLLSRKVALDARFSEHTVKSKGMIEEYQEVKDLLC